MEIEQFLYDLNDGGDAVVGYTVSSGGGGVVQLCNLGASLLSYEVPGVGRESLLEGRCVRRLSEDMVAGVRFDEMLWESRVETNRVVMSLQYEEQGAEVMAEVVFDFDDDNTLEITYIASVGGEEGAAVATDLTHRFVTPLSVVEMGSFTADPDADPDAAPDAKDIYISPSAKQNILSNVFSLEGGMEVTSSQPQVALQEGGFTLLTAPQRVVQQGERYVQKSVFRIVK